MLLSLDLSTTCTGWAKYDEIGKLVDFGRIIPDDKLHHFLKIKYIVNELIGHLLEADNLVVEGIFLNTFTGGFHNVTSFELLARLSGAVINSYLQSHDVIPIIYKATEARKLVGVKPSAQKAEIQLWVINEFGAGKHVPLNNVTGNIKSYQMLIPDDVDLMDYESLIDSAYAELGTGTIKRPAFKSRMDKISKMIEEATGMGEDICDSILLGKAFINDKKKSLE